MIDLDLDEPPVVVAAGAPLFAEALAAQAAAPRNVEWAPPVPDTSAALAAIAADPANRVGHRRVGPPVEHGSPATGSTSVRRPRSLGPGAARVPARRPARDVGRRVRPAARRTGRRDGLRGTGRQRRGGRANRGQRRRVAGTVPLARDGRSDGRRRQRLDAGVGARGRGARRHGRTARSTRAWARCSASAPTPPRSSTACAGCRSVLGPAARHDAAPARPDRHRQPHRPGTADGRRVPQPQPRRNVLAAARDHARSARIRSVHSGRHRGVPVHLRQRPLLPQPGDAGGQGGRRRGA